MQSRLGTSVLAGGLLLLVAGCGGRADAGDGGLGLGNPRGPMESLAGVTICGVQLAAPSVLQPVAFDISGGRTAGRLALGSVGTVIFVRTSDSCDRGADFSISPHSAMTITKVARADDGKPAGAALTVQRATSISISTSAGGRLTISPNVNR